MLAAAIIVVVAAVLSVLLFFLLAGERGRPRPSTWAFLRQAGFRLNALHGYIYGRWTPQYIKALFRLSVTSQPVKAEHWLAERYHGKVLTHEHARAVVTINKSIPLRDLEQIVPYPAARNIVLEAPPDIVVYECVCRHSRPNHCGPTQVCMVIGKPMSDFVLEHQPASARRVTQSEALELLAAERERGHVHSAWFKDAMLNRFYAICNCCKCCCGGISEMNRGVRMMASSGYVAEIDQDLCSHCWDCVETCPFKALSRDGDVLSRDWGRCMGCGVCELKCATGAVTLVRDERKGVPLDVRAFA